MNYQERLEPLRLGINCHEENPTQRSSGRAKRRMLSSGVVMRHGNAEPSESLAGDAGGLWLNAGREEGFRLVMEGWEVENEVP